MRPTTGTCADMHGSGGYERPLPANAAQIDFTGGPAYVAPVHRRNEITLAGLRFHALVGVLAHERELPQPIEVDVSVQLERAMRGDQPALDYRAAYAATERVVATATLHCLERTAEQVADAVLGLHGVTAGRVAVRKPHVMLAGPLAYAEVAVERGHAYRTGSDDDA